MANAPAHAIRVELRRAREAGRVHGAYLLEGPRGTGKRATALWFARLLLCRVRGEDPCDACADCVRSRPRESGEEVRPGHADLLWVEPMGGVLRVDQVRALQRGLALAANEGGWRVAVLLSADRLRREAANALLKTLEEPPSRTTLLLVADQAAAIPATVRSRVVRLRFVPEPEPAVRESLEQEGIPAEDAWLAAALGGGTREAALEWGRDHVEEAREFRDWVEEAGARSESDVLDFAETFRGGAPARERAELFLDVGAAIARRRVEEALGRDDPTDAERWLAHAERSHEARRELRRRNLNPQMVVEALLLDLRRAVRSGAG